jgi:parvulin-like peptidyl-prolyl isomerase
MAQSAQERGFQLSTEVLRALEQGSEAAERELEQGQGTAEETAPPAEALRALEEAQHSPGDMPALAPGRAPSEEVIRELEAADQNERVERSDAAVAQGVFQSWELRLDLAPETVLVTRAGEEFLTIQDFNQRVGRARGDDLYHARRRALEGMIRDRLLALMATDAGLAEDPAVEKRVGRAVKAQDHAGAETVDAERFSVSGAEVSRYYRTHIDDFRKPDIGTRARVAVRSSEDAAAALRQAVIAAPDDPALWPGEPIPGERLPHAVRDALFHAAPGDVTEVIATPAGYYVARLEERNAFEHARVKVRTFPTEAAAREALAGGAADVFTVPDGDDSERLVALEALPQAVQEQVHGMTVGEVSEPIPSALGFMVVTLVTRWSEAPIERATVVAVSSPEAGARALRAFAQDRLTAEADLSPRVLSEADLPESLLAFARTLKQGLVAGPVTTDLGTFLLRVDARERQPYRPLAEVRDDIVRRLRASMVAEEEKRAHYAANREEYRLDAPLRVLDVLVSGGPDDGLERLRSVASVAEPTERVAAFESILAETGFESVPATQLPVPLAEIAAGMQPGAVSDVIGTDVGYFVVRLREVRDPAYAPFEAVAVDIGATLADRAEEALALEAVRAERDREIVLEQAEDKALAFAYKEHYQRDVDSVSDAEAEAWWKRNGGNMLAAFGVDASDIPQTLREQPGLSMEVIKRNVLLERLKHDIDQRRKRERIVVNDYLLDY